MGMEFEDTLNEITGGQPEPSAHDILKHEDAKRPHNEALEKHGADIETEILERLRAERGRDT